MTAPVLEDRRPSVRRLIGFVLLLTGVAWGLGALAAFPWEASERGAAVIRVAFKHVAAFEQAARAPSKEELEKLPRHMRPQRVARAGSGARVPTDLRVALDGRLVLHRTYTPGGVRHDGPTFGYEELAVRPGRHRLEVTLADRQPEEGPATARRRWELAEDVEIRPGQALLVEFSEDGGLRLR